MYDALRLRKVTKKTAMQLNFFDIWNNNENILGFFRKKKSSKKIYHFKKPSEPKLLAIWESLAKTYFPNNSVLNDYSIHWSNRAQKRTLASCNLQGKRILVARELNYDKYSIWLEPLIYHEMCHAVLGLNVKKVKGKKQWHGKDFKNLENKHPLMYEFEMWIKAGGWAKCVRSDRATRAHARRKI